MKKQPILIYKGADICYNTLNFFAEQFGLALQELGACVEYYDVAEQDINGLTAYFDRSFRAVVGFQSYLFDIYLPKAGKFIHDFINGPKFNFQFDHPVWMKSHYEKMPEDCYLLTHDRTYAAFARTYYPDIRDVFLLPPGGLEDRRKEPLLWEDRPYTMAFLGTYTDYRRYEAMRKNADAVTARIGEAFAERMWKHPEETAEQSFEIILKELEIQTDRQQFLEIFGTFAPVIYEVMSRYREKTVEALLQNGIPLEVYGDTWKTSPFAGQELFHIHEPVAAKDSLQELGKSRFSLNVMAWHKDGFTERIANSMLNGSVAVSDYSRQLSERYKDGEELLLFHLTDLDSLPEKILASQENGAAMAEKALKKAREQDTWKNRAESFLEILDGLAANKN